MTHTEMLKDLTSPTQTEIPPQPQSIAGMKEV